MAFSNLSAGVRQREAVALDSVNVMAHSLIENSAVLALAQAELLARQPENVRAVADRDHDRLVAMQSSLFAYMKAEAGIDLVQYQTADLKTLVRMQDPLRWPLWRAFTRRRSLRRKPGSTCRAGCNCLRRCASRPGC